MPKYTVDINIDRTDTHVFTVEIEAESPEEAEELALELAVDGNDMLMEFYNKTYDGDYDFDSAFTDNVEEVEDD